MEDSLCKEEEVVAALNVDIEKWKKEIEVLKSKVEEAEHKKNEMQKASRQQLDVEVSIGVQHLENFNNLDVESEGFATTISQADRRLDEPKIQYEKLKASFTF